MKKILLIIFVLSFTFISAQSNADFARVFLKRATISAGEIDFKAARISFEKAMTYMEAITEKEVASLGATIYFDEYDKQKTEKLQLDFLNKALYYSKQYFLLDKNNRSEAFSENLDVQLSIKDAMKKVEKKIAENELERIKKEKELKKIDSLKTIWNNKSKSLAIAADTIYSFNAKNFALFKHKGKYGILNDRAEVIVEAAEYGFGVSYDGFIVLQNTALKPTKIYYLNTTNGSGNTLPPPSDINPISTHYGKVMLPRANGRLVTYLNNSYEPLVFDLVQHKVVRLANLEEVLKALKKNDRIKKYNNDGEVKLDKDWYFFGGHLGGGVHPLYAKGNYKVHGYLFSIDGTMLLASNNLEYIGAFHENKLQAFKDGTVSWINQNGTEVNAPVGAFKEYKGNSKIVKIEEGVYQIFKEGKIIKGEEELEKMAAFLRKFQK